jgi:hypothetical protein
MQEPKSFPEQLFDKNIDSCSIATGPIETDDEARFDGVIPGFKHDREWRWSLLEQLALQEG